MSAPKKSRKKSRKSRCPTMSGFQKSRGSHAQVTAFAKPQVKKSRLSHGISHGTPSPYRGRRGCHTQAVTSQTTRASKNPKGRTT